MSHSLPTSDPYDASTFETPIFTLPKSLRKDMTILNESDLYRILKTPMLNYVEEWRITRSLGLHKAVMSFWKDYGDRFKESWKQFSKDDRQKLLKPLVP
ncbi:hypothetical protein HDV05_002074, partial [Chytridiales sp. JEL 0842]